MNPFKVVEDFEKAVANYASAPYCVALNSCTNALFLCLEWEKLNLKKHYNSQYVEIPKRTYIGVAQSILNAGFEVHFREENWHGYYQLEPFDIWDCAKRFTFGMYSDFNGEGLGSRRTFVCTSHHWQKILGIQQGGCILHNDAKADEWFRRARFDGRTPGIPASQEREPIRGWHMYMSPEVAAEGLVRLSHLPKHNKDLPMDNYPDLSQMEIFK